MQHRSSIFVTAGLCWRRSKVITRHENHPLGTEATLIYNLGPLSWAINKLRRAMGVVFGTAGRAIYAGLELWHSQVGCPGVPHLFFEIKGVIMHQYECLGQVSQARWRLSSLLYEPCSRETIAQRAHGALAAQRSLRCGAKQAQEDGGFLGAQESVLDQPHEFEAPSSAKHGSLKGAVPVRS